MDSNQDLQSPSLGNSRKTLEDQNTVIRNFPENAIREEDREEEYKNDSDQQYESELRRGEQLDSDQDENDLNEAPIHTMRVQYGNEYGEQKHQKAGLGAKWQNSGDTLQNDQYESYNQPLGNGSSCQRSRASFQDQQHTYNQDEGQYLNMAPSSNGKETHLSSNIYRGADDARYSVDRIVPYQRDSNSSGSRRCLDVESLFPESGQLLHLVDDQQRDIARSGDYEVQSRKMVNQVMMESIKTNHDTRIINQQTSFNQAQQISENSLTEQTERSIESQAQNQELQNEAHWQRAKFINDNQTQFLDEQKLDDDLSDLTKTQISKRNQDLNSFYNQLEAQNQLNSGSQRNQIGFRFEGKHSSVKPSATQTTQDAPQQHHSLNRPAIISQTSNTKRNANQNTFNTNSSNQNALSYSPGGQVVANSGTIDVGDQHQMKTIPFNNYMSERHAAELLIQEQHQDHYNHQSQIAKLKKLMSGDLTQTNEELQEDSVFIQQQQNHSVELEGLDLTEEDLERPDMSVHIPNTQTKQIMTQNKLSTINDYTAKDSYNLSDEHQLSQIRALGNLQGNFENLEQVEAELQAEVEQLDLIYAQHKNMNYQQMQRRAMALQDSTDKFIDNFDESSQMQNSYSNQNNALQFSNNQYNNDGIYGQIEEYQDRNDIHVQQLQQNYIYSDNSLSIGGFQQKIDSDNQNHFDQADDNQFSNDDQQLQEDVHSNQREENEDYMTNHKDDYANMVIKSLQDQVTQLSNYKQICEQRIRQLQPGHPLPIKMEHMNQPNYAMLQQHQNQIDKLILQHRLEKGQIQKEIELLKTANQLSVQSQVPTQFEMGNSFGGDGQQTDKKVKATMLSHDNTNAHMNSSSVEYSMQLNQQVTQMRQAFEQIKQEKYILEKSLRQETQINEELSLKLQILKDSLEQKFSVEYPQLKAYIVTSQAQSQQRILPYNSTVSPASTEKESTKRSITHLMSTRNTNNMDGAQSQVVDYYMQIGQTKAENEILKKKVQSLITQLEKEQHINQLHDKQEQIYQSQLNQVTNGQSMMEAEAKKKAMEQELSKQNAEIKFYKDQIDQLKKQNYELQQQQRQLLSSVQDIDSKTSNLYKLRLENDTKSKEISHLTQEIENLSKKLRDQENLREGLQFSIKEGNERVGIYQNRVRDESNEICELKKIIDDQHLELNKREQATNRAKEEAKMSDKKGEMEIESLNHIITQNKEYIEAQEHKLRNAVSNHQSEILSYRKKFEEQNLIQMQKISELNCKIAELDQKCFTAEFEKAQVDETMIENTNVQQNFEIVSVKHKQLTDRNRHLVNQNSNAQKRTAALEKKLDLNFQQIENLQTQNDWLKEERQKTIEQNLVLKQDFDGATKQKQEIQHQLNMFNSKDKIETQRVMHALEMKTNLVTNQEQKLVGIEHTLSSIQTQKEVLETTNKQLQRNLIETQSNLQNSCRDKILLEKQLLDIKEENEQLYRNEERVKRLVADLEAQKTQTHVMFKENQYNESKVKKFKNELDHLESEIRILNRDKSELNETVIQLKNKQNQSNTQLLDQIAESQKLRSELDQHVASNSNLTCQSKMDNYKVGELQSKIDRLEAYTEDLRSQVSRNISKNNENCLKFEQETKVLESVKLIQENAMRALIIPFLQSLTDQLEASDILKQALFNQDPQNRSFEMFKTQAARFMCLDKGSDVLATQRQLVFEYAKFVQQDVIEKLIASVIDGQSDIILQTKKNQALNLRLNAQQEESHGQKKTNDQLSAQIESMQQLISQNEAESKRVRNQLATCRQKIKSLEEETETLRIVSKEKDREMVNIIKEKENTKDNHSINDKDQINQQLQNEQLEKKYLWKALKCLKVFLKSNEHLQGLLAMLNEYIILLEQVMFDKKQNQKILDTQRIWETQQKLKVVENDMKCFKLGQLMGLKDPKKDQPLARCNSTTYQSQPSKGMRSMRLPLDNQTNFSQLIQTQSSHYNQLGMRLNYQTQAVLDSRPPKPLFNGTQNYHTNQKI